MRLTDPMSIRFLQPRPGGVPSGAAEPAGDGPPRAAVSELADILLVLQRRFLVRLSRELAPGGVSFAQFFLLDALATDKTLTMSEIAARMGHTTAAATGLVDRLENLGYVARAHATDDRRKVRVCATATGQALVERIREDMIGNLFALMTYLDHDEQHAWLSIYRKIHAVCADQPESVTPVPIPNP